MEDRTVVGWYLVGPMEAVCTDHAADEAGVRALYEGRTILDLWVLDDEGVESADHEITCARCGRVL